MYAHLEESFPGCDAGDHGDEYDDALRWKSHRNEGVAPELEDGHENDHEASRANGHESGHDRSHGRDCDRARARVCARAHAHAHARDANGQMLSTLSS